MNLQSKSTKTSLTIIFFLWLFLSVWWLYLNVLTTASDSQRYAFGATYGLMALCGAIYGVYSSKKWGGLKSALGTALLFLGLGLAAAEFGQLVFSYYNIVKGVEIPYPSVADIGFFGAIPLYILAAIAITRVTGVKYSFKSLFRKILFLILPLVGLGFSYAFFLRTYDFTDAAPLRVFLDFGYPLGQALYVGIALLIYVASVKFLGGVMKLRILFLLAAFVLQYIAEFNFLYQTLHGTWLNGGYGDYLYLLAYTVMTITLVLFSYIPAQTKPQNQFVTDSVPNNE